jgi:glutathione S-transferase
MLKVIGGRRNRGFRVIWALEEMDLPYTLEEARPQSAEVLAVNPLGQVPVLMDGDAVLTDSLAILNYLADRNGALTFPAGTVERARLDARINFVLTEMEAPLWLMARHGFVLPENQRMPGMRAVAEADFARAAARFEVLLGGADFFAGDRFTIADIVAGHTANWARNAKVPVGGALLSYLDRMTARDGFRRAMGEA